MGSLLLKMVTCLIPLAMKYSLVFYLLMCLCCLQANAQLSDSLYKSLPDTLKPKKKLAITDQERIKLINETDQPFQLHYYNDFQDITLQLEKYIDSVQDRVEKIPYANAIASFYMSTDEQEKYFLWEKKLAAYGEGATKYQYYICNAYANMSIYYSSRSKQDSAIALLHKGLDIANKNTDGENLQYILYYGYIQVYRYLNLYATALEYIDKYLKALPAKDKWNDAYTEVVMSKANVYAHLFRNEKKPAYADSVKTLVQQTMLAKKNEAAYWYFLCYFYQGFLAYYQQQYQQAIRYFDLALSPAYKPMQGYRFYLAQLYKNASLIALGRPEGVGGLISVSIPAKDFQGHKEANRVLYQYYTQHKDYQKALAHYEQYKAWADSVDVIGQRGKVFEAEQKYSVAQKEAAIAQLRNKNLEEKNAKRDVVIISLIVLISLLLLYLYNRRQLTKRVLEGQQLADRLQTMEKAMTIQQVRQRTENESALNAQRKSISRNMHDEVSSSVATLRFLIKDRIGHTKNKETKQVLAELEDETTEVYQQIRDFMHRLHISDPTPAYDVIDFLDNLSLTFGSGSSLQVNTRYDADCIERHFTPIHHTEVYLFIKEVVTNAMKHSGASRLTIDVYAKNDSMYIDVRDNGKGIDSTNRGIGMESMQDRMKILGGEATFWTDSGLHIQARFPIG